MSEEAVRLTGPWAGVAAALRAVSGRVDEAIKLATRQSAEGLVGEIKKGITTGTLLDGSHLKELHPFTVLRRLATMGPSARAHALEQIAAGKSARPLFNHGDLVNSFAAKYSPDGWSAVVGVNRQAKTSDGAYMVNVAKTLFYGKSIRVTDKLRGFLGANGLHLRKTTQFITIPPRDPIAPTWRAYKETVQNRYREALQGAMRGLIRGGSK